MNAYLSILQELAEYRELLKDCKENKTPIHVSGVSDSAAAHLIYCVTESLQTGGLIVTADLKSANALYEDLRFFCGEKVLLFPESDLLFYDIEARGQEITHSRLQVIRALCERSDYLVVTTAAALSSVTVPREICIKRKLRFAPGDTVSVEDVAEALTELGYCREELTEEPGQFSIRGGIIDIYPCTEGSPVRIELFDTEVDSVRAYDPQTQRTVQVLEEAEIYPARELLLTEKQRGDLLKTLRRICETVCKGEQGEREVRLCNDLQRDTERLEQKVHFPSLDKYIPYLYKTLPTLLDYLPAETPIFWQEPVRIREAMDAAAAELAESAADLAERGVLYAADGEYRVPYGKLLRRVTKNRLIGMGGLQRRVTEFRPVRSYAFAVKSVSGFQGKTELLCDSLRFYQKNIYRTVIAAGSVLRAKNLQLQLEDEGFRCSLQTELEALPNPGGIVITSGSLCRGFEYPLIRTAVIGDREVFGESEKKRRRKPVPKGEKISAFTDLNPGDFVVHRNHGIGKYIGIEQLAVEGIRKDYLKIAYRGTDVLYVPTDQMDMVYKHTAKEDGVVALSKLGGTDWVRAKQKAKAAASDMAEKLIALYAKRSKIKGIAFQKDTEWQRDFEAAFPFEETADQLRSIDEVKADMELPHPMDRLLCGDVGYGKTEVAMRAAFKAVMSGYQVAYLVPTTILASQQYQNFKQRMMHYPVRIELLSRFCTPAQEKATRKGLKTGEVDIVIGTHKVLGKDVEFHKLGFLVIDEEQRFGVAHKEKLKELRKEVDVLTLSATPIPRTLHMSLSGIRDMSLLGEPPRDRYPVATYVLEYDEAVIREAILREVGRGGQVYYLFNRVDGIYRAANRLAEQIPNIRVAVAHGKMRERELEDIMQAVSEGEIDVLVCTTIIETGLDIANVNTLIIEDADRLGLAQMYQLRGRVGRSDRLAYAYLTFRRDKMLSEEAEKRLLAIKEFTEFGSGFKIAMRDLEIRGTGNLIGAEQHGHMEAVGYEMYCRLLEQAIREQKGEAEEVLTETKLELPVSAFIPEDYITGHSRRIGAYKRIAATESREEILDVYDEMQDRYGTVPPEVHNLMEAAYLRHRAQKCGVSEIIGSDDKVLFRFDEAHIPNPENLIALLSARSDDCYLPNPNQPKLYLKRSKPLPGKEAEYFSAIDKILEELQPKQAENMNRM